MWRRGTLARETNHVRGTQTQAIHSGSVRVPNAFLDGGERLLVFSSLREIFYNGFTLP